jgi:UDP:flavonoid glycosyltransferase YjiC (YdhE family)
LDSLKGKRLYFAPCGIGLGHVSRSIPIAREIMDRGGDLLFSTYLEGLTFLRMQKLPVVSSPPISWITDSSGSINLKKTAISGIASGATFLKQLKAEIQHIKQFKPDLVFSDTRLSSVVAADLLNIPVILVLNQFQVMVPREKDVYSIFRFLDGGLLTLLGYGWGLSNLILIPDFPQPYTISMDSLRVPKPYTKLIRYIGAILSNRPEDVRDSGKIRESLISKPGDVLVYAGISGPKPERQPLLNILEPIFQSLPENYKIVMSMGDPSGGSEPVKTGNLIKIPWIKDRYSFLKACDVVISRAGHETIMQSVCYGKPSILIPVPKHTEQFSNARRSSELEISLSIHQDNLSPETLLDSLKEIAYNPLYTEKLKIMNGKGVLRNGVNNCIDAIIEVLNANDNEML